MQHLGRVKEFVVGHCPWPICNDCIADKLDISAGEPMTHRVNELAQMPRFVRERAGCSFCKQIKEVTRFA
jgi:hypothetical protein